ncbi:spore coat protein YlbD [Salirhabdus sp. Marseille-P4669]|uniref:spore coat protein YlbD n=1 Tax=Salirhabdus sp. Marseille-P4669 TaxID=2042310 RepID=UPI000C7E4FB3|nr:spore coat protein YlbD [Salirhabdus sp. Marseille-P4669]
MGKLHPKVSEFKAFIEKHPKLIKHVRSNKESWQPYYEKWLYYGEEDEYWEQFSDQGNEKQTDGNGKQYAEMFQKVSGMLNNLDLNKLQEQMSQLNGVLSNVQSILQQYQQNKQQQPFFQSKNNRPNPFKFGKD